MNKFLRGMAVVAGLGGVALGGGLLAGGTAQAQTVTIGVGGGGVGVSVSAFYDALAPYGSWEWMEGYGRVWRPNPYVVGSNFQPYSTGGRWVYTDYGWSWESDWNWGWAPFHYGRWSADPVMGWVWIPGNEWAPAWVDWRFGGGYAGWCPLGPDGAGATYRPYWSFVQTQYLVEPNVYHYAVPVSRIHSAYQATRPVQQRVNYNRNHWSAGPPPAQVGRAAGREIRPVSVRPPPPGHVQVVRPVGSPVRSAPGRTSGVRPTPGASGIGSRATPQRPGPSGVTSRPQVPSRGGFGQARPPVAGGFSAPPSRGGVAQPPPSRFGNGNTGVVPPSRTTPSRFGNGNTGVVPPSRSAPSRFGNGNTGVVPPSRTAPSRQPTPSRSGFQSPPARSMPQAPPSNSGFRSPPVRSAPQGSPPQRSAPSFHPAPSSSGGARSAPSRGGGSHSPSRGAPSPHRGR